MTLPDRFARAVSGNILRSRTERHANGIRKRSRPAKNFFTGFRAK
jgi:hypothetical protein